MKKIALLLSLVTMLWSCKKDDLGETPDLAKNVSGKLVNSKGKVSSCPLPTFYIYSSGITDGGDACEGVAYDVSVPNYDSIVWDVYGGAVTHVWSANSVRVVFNHDLVTMGWACIDVTAFDPCTNEPQFYELSVSNNASCDPPEW